MTSTASLHFGPEWMRKPTRAAPTSPNPTAVATNTTPPQTTPFVNGNGPAPVPPLGSHSSYSALLSGTTPPPDTQPDDTLPFRYSKEQMLAVWKNGGGQGELGLEVERWQGIVREIADEPMGLKEFSSEEKKVRLSIIFFTSSTTSPTCHEACVGQIPLKTRLFWVFSFSSFTDTFFVPLLHCSSWRLLRNSCLRCLTTQIHRNYVVEVIHIHPTPPSSPAFLTTSTATVANLPAQ
jgi:hypothetical protein